VRRGKVDPTAAAAYAAYSAITNGAWDRYLPLLRWAIAQRMEAIK
jgi:hypothetical protein